MFFEILSAINDPNQQASVSQLEQVIKSIQQLASNQGVNAQQMQSMMTVVGQALHPILQQKQSQMGMEQLASKLSIVRDRATLQSVITPETQQQLIQTIAQKTGMQANTAQTMLPQLLPLIMQLFQLGTPIPGSVNGTNALLSDFLNGNRTNSTDLGNVVKFAERFLNAPN